MNWRGRVLRRFRIWIGSIRVSGGDLEILFDSYTILFSSLRKATGGELREECDKWDIVKMKLIPKQGNGLCTPTST